MKTGFVLWFTGLSGSGKSTLAARLADRLTQDGIHVESLDGDEVRKYLSYGLGFSREDRDQNVRRIGFVARALARSGACAITAAISPYRELRDEVRSLTPRFCEVYCECPIEVLASRDPKGLYKKALAGEIKNFTGVDDPYEAPLAPEVHLRTDQQTPDECEAIIIARLRELGLLGGEETEVRLPAPYGGELAFVPARPLDPSGTLPRIDITADAADACVVMALGYLSPVCGFMSERETEKVRKVGHLERGFGWPTPLVLEVGSQHQGLAPGGRVVLKSPAGQEVAELAVHEVLAREAGTVLAGSLLAVAPDAAGPPAAAEIRKQAIAGHFCEPLVVVETNAPDGLRALAAQAMARAAQGLILLTTREQEGAWRGALASLERVLVVPAPGYLLQHQEFWAIAAQNLGGSRMLFSLLGA